MIKIYISKNKSGVIWARSFLNESTIRKDILSERPTSGFFQGDDDIACITTAKQPLQMVIIQTFVGYSEIQTCRVEEKIVN
jgi:hypothetical protein